MTPQDHIENMWLCFYDDNIYSQVLIICNTVRSLCKELRASCLVTNVPSQTECKQALFVSGPPAVWPLSVKQGPTRWASMSLILLRFLTAWAGQANECPVLHRSLLLSRQKDPKISPMHPSSMFFQAWSHRGEKTAPPLPSLHCSVSRGQEDTSPNHQMSRQF